MGRNQKGFTLVEMVMAMAVFSVIMVMVGTSFSTLLKYSSRYMKSEESNIEGNVGLELMRHDVASAGFGLPTAFTDPSISYQEVASGLGATLNDSPSAGVQSAVPKAIWGVIGNPPLTATPAGDGYSYTLLQPPTGSGTTSDYLALKATSLGTQGAVSVNKQSASQKWSYASYSTPSFSHTPMRWPSGNLNPGDQVVVQTRSATSSNGSYQLLNAGSQFATALPAGPLGYPFNPRTQADSAYIYGVAESGSPTPLRFPFNRADYFVASPPAGMLPNYCAPGTGILYRGVVRHADGKLDYQPVLDCVADMHVVLGWNTTGSGAVDTWSKVDGSGFSSSAGVTTPPGGTAAQVSAQLKVVKVYILAQNGKMDPGYTSPATFQLYDPAEEHQTPGATYTLPSNMLNYRWKVYKLIIRPKNLASNQ